MEMLDKLALPHLNNQIIQEILHDKVRYEDIENIKDNRVNKSQKKKVIISEVFDIFLGLFNLKYEQKLRFNQDGLSEDDIYLGNYEKLNFDQVFYNLYFVCFKKYLEDIHNLNNNRLDEKFYTIARLAILNNDENTIKKMVNNTFIELFCDVLEINFVKDDIKFQEIVNLNMINNKRNYTLKEEVVKYPLNKQLSPLEIRNVYTCFSQDIFLHLNKEEKNCLANLLLNYYSLEPRFEDYKKRINPKTSNSELVELVIKDLLVEGNSLLVKRRNIDTINDVLSGVKYIYKNETKKSNLNNFAYLKNLTSQYKR